MTNNQLNLGLLSTAWVNEWAVFNARRHESRVTVVAVASRDADRARQYAEARRIPKWYGSYQALLDDDSVDAVFLSMPNSAHAPWTMGALLSGKHVLCEKPLGIGGDIVDTLQRFALERNLILTEAMHYRYHAAVVHWIDRLRSGEFGRILDVDVRTGWDLLPTRTKDIRLDPRLGGGSLLDVGCYCVDLAHWLAGDEDPLILSASCRRGSWDVDIGVDVSLQWLDGVRARIRCELDAPDFQCLADVRCDRGLVRLCNPFLPVIPDAIHPRCAFRVHVNGSERPVSSDTRTSYAFQLSAFVDAVSARRPCARASSASRRVARTLASIAARLS